MKRNRFKKESALGVGSAGIVSLILCMFLVTLVYWWADSRCKTISNEIGKCERQLTKTKNELQNELSHWDEMRIKGRMNELLKRSGLQMDFERSDQLVHVDRNGQVVKNCAQQRIASRTANSMKTIASVTRQSSQVSGTRVARTTSASSRTSASGAKRRSATARR